MPSSSNEVRIERGSIIIYRVFDIAEEIDLHGVEKTLSGRSSESRLRLASKSRDAVVIRNAPLRLSLGEVDLSHRNEKLNAEAVATLWDYGAVSIAFQIPIPKGMSWSKLMDLSALLNTDEVFLGKIEAAGRVRAEELSTQLKSSLKGPSVWGVSEDYTIYFFEEIAGIKNGQDLLKAMDIPALILSEPKEVLSPMVRESILDNTFQYSDDDFVVIDWNSAVVLEPSGQREIPDVLEFALTHLLEVRFYDDLLDRRLAGLYDSIEEGRDRIFRSQFKSISEEANTRFLEFSEFLERMNNSLKVVGDFYLARIFRGAIRRFRIPDWEDTITRKMNLLARVSELLQGELNVRRGHLLEFIIILLILFELISTLVKGLG